MDELDRHGALQLYEHHGTPLERCEFERRRVQRLMDSLIAQCTKQHALDLPKAFERISFAKKMREVRRLLANESQLIYTWTNESINDLQCKQCSPKK